jgi:hypothetical protein
MRAAGRERVSGRAGWKLPWAAPAYDSGRPRVDGWGPTLEPLLSGNRGLIEYLPARAARARARAQPRTSRTGPRTGRAGRTLRMSSAPRPTRPKFGPPLCQTIYKSVPISLWSFLTFIRTKGWKAASSPLQGGCAEPLGRGPTGDVVPRARRADDARAGQVDRRTTRA